jgi:uncharacterized protein (DUF58 family)
MAEAPLLEEAIRHKLERLMLVANKVRAGAIKGERRSNRRGTSIEFADYRNYAPGDDLRRLDWNVYARLRRPYIKLLEDEEDLAVHILLDVSASMDWPADGELSPEYNKLLYGRRLLAGLGYIALNTNDRLIASAISERGWESFGPTRGRAQNIGLLKYAQGLRAGGVTELNPVLRDYALRANRPGLCFIISDLFSPDGYLDGLMALLARGYEVVLLHVLSPDEITPELAGDLRLVDVETSVAQEVSLDPEMRDLYQRRVIAWRESVQDECRRRDVHYLALQTDSAWEKVLLYDLRRLGLVK